MTPSATRPALRLIQGALDDVPGWAWFCGQCAAMPPEGSVSPHARVCRSCGMGLLLETRSDAAPVHGDAFLVVDSRLTVQALSGPAQMLLGISEEDVIDRPVARFLAGADAETRGPGDFMAVLHAASTESDELQSLSVRPEGAFGVRLLARIAACGPPRAALVVLGDPAPRHELRVVDHGTPPPRDLRSRPRLRRR